MLAYHNSSFAFLSSFAFFRAERFCDAKKNNVKVPQKLLGSHFSVYDPMDALFCQDEIAKLGARSGTEFFYFCFTN